MKISALINKVPFKVLQGSIDKQINSIEYHTDNVSENDLFVAISGFSLDGHDFIPLAVDCGATAIIIENAINVKINNSVTVIEVPSSRQVLAHISSIFYNLPSEKLNLIGITGTNGKTSIAYLLNSIYEQAKKNVGVMGTTGFKINNNPISLNTSTPTTPESLDLQKALYHMAEMNVSHCIMEVSSHALHLDRVEDTTFQTGIFTNLSPDHLELHKNMDEYFSAKAKLFSLTKQHNIINIDDPYGQRLVQLCSNYQAEIVTYSIHDDADITAKDIHYTLKGTTYTVQTPTYEGVIHVHLPGEIYVYNSLAAIATAYAEGLSLETIQKGIESVKHIDGRFEIIYERNDFNVIIDFAHTEDALEQTLKTVRPYVKGKLILVFGVYADMSHSGQMKRKNMGKVAAKFADFSIVTLDNPKFFNQKIIMDEITNAIDNHNGSYMDIPDRKEAIQKAIEISTDQDTILIAGKGHETSQNIKGIEIPINEKEIVLEALAHKVI